MVFSFPSRSNSIGCLQTTLIYTRLQPADCDVRFSETRLNGYSNATKGKQLKRLRRISFLRGVTGRNRASMKCCLYSVSCVSCSRSQDSRARARSTRSEEYTSELSHIPLSRM